MIEPLVDVCSLTAAVGGVVVTAGFGGCCAAQSLSAFLGGAPS